MISEKCSPALLAVDWGSSSLRAYLLDSRGSVLHSRATPHGVFHLPAGGFEAAFEELLSEWEPLPPRLPMLACGMIGSAQGWLEVPYVRCPAAPADIAAGIVPLKLPRGRTLHIVPGAALSGEMPNVMRGEETQVIGALADHARQASEVTIVLPGTHSKWVKVRHERIETFDTFMTGELFELLRNHSSIGHIATMSPEATAEGIEAFHQGLRHATASAETSVLRLLFTTRSRVLLGQLHPCDALEYLSGLLIGEEVRLRPSTGDCLLVGSADLCDRYERAFTLLSPIRPRLVESATTRGLHLLAAAAGLLKLDS
ncbi:2-dehydro-3-deoxygalactonokinase [Burkholderia pseudomallei]|uniref:2-dehydro-3-deoxygalactonokinase n=1 Tax=Burkholderia pseudomallei TaxID=28450 RepID=UPI0009B2249C|nr:2-dehydro-3-deoxygalactonokinase [Burkholderia pseudomallei]